MVRQTMQVGRLQKQVETLGQAKGRPGKWARVWKVYHEQKKNLEKYSGYITYPISKPNVKFRIEWGKLEEIWKCLENKRVLPWNFQTQTVTFYVEHT